IAVVQGTTAPTTLPQRDFRWAYPLHTAEITYRELANGWLIGMDHLWQGLAGGPIRPRDDKPESIAAAPLNWFLQNLDLFIVPDSDEEKALAKIAGPILEEQKKLLARIKLDSRLTPAMQD